MAADKVRNKGAGRGRDRLLQDRLVRLWKRLTGERESPLLDRWLGRELAGLDGLPRADRLFLGELLADGVRFGALTLFCEVWRREGWREGADPGQRLEAWATIEGRDLWRRLRRLPVPVVFFWTFMRKREEGAVLPPIDPPGPDTLDVWRSVKAWARSAADPAVRALWAGLPVSLAPLVAGRAALSDWTETDRLVFLDAHATRPPLWLRLADKRGRAAVLSELAREGFTVTAGRGSALAVAGARGIYELTCYQEGLVHIQDLASQAIGTAVAPGPGHAIWDCCAGAGGKSLQLAAMLRGKGIVHATDLFEGKLKDLRKRSRRAGCSNVVARLWDGQRVPDFGPEIAGRGGFNRVLVDAPCSGSGTWRRNPEGRLRFATGQLPDLAAVQLDLLALTAGAVRPGGLVVYATCSWFRAENEDVVAAFLTARPEFSLRAQSIHGNPKADADTTFTAVMERRT
jgi:16S rRNA (cytosine967-C5)-methyltransferase